jgi:hypothetical protein
VKSPLTISEMRTHARAQLAQLPASKKAAMDKANADLEISRVELRASTLDLHHKERLAGEATNQWRVTQNAYWDPTIPEHVARIRARDHLVKDQVARENAERLTRVARGESPEAPKVVANHQSELDRVMFERGKTKVNRGPVYYGPRATGPGNR